MKNLLIVFMMLFALSACSDNTASGDYLSPTRDAVVKVFDFKNDVKSKKILLDVEVLEYTEGHPFAISYTAQKSNKIFGTFQLIPFPTPAKMKPRLGQGERWLIELELSEMNSENLVFRLVPANNGDDLPNMMLYIKVVGGK